jgi:translation initiation factor 2 subunit 2
MSEPKSDYEQWLAALYSQLNQVRQPHKSAQTKINVPRPVTGRIGSKITKWDNFQEMCARIHRDPQNVADYISKELCTTISLTDKEELKIRYRLGPDKACAIFSKYMNEWVRCTGCKSLHTTLSKNPVGRYYVIHCESCLSDTNK